MDFNRLSRKREKQHGPKPNAKKRKYISKKPLSLVFGPEHDRSYCL